MSLEAKIDIWSILYCQQMAKKMLSTYEVIYVNIICRQILIQNLIKLLSTN